MKAKLLYLLFVLMTAAHAVQPDVAAPAPSLQPLASQSQAAHMTAVVLTRLHYKAMPLDDAMSKKIFDSYLKALDGEKFFLTRRDVEQLQSGSTKLDDAIVEGELELPFAIFNLYAQRMSERFAYARGLLKAGFDFTQKESYAHERKKKNWPESDKEMDERWRKRVKNDWLVLKLEGKSEASIVETLDKRYESWQKRVTQTKSEDVFELFMNSYASAIDPHSGYLGPRAAEDFDISMSLSLFGIGAALSQKDDYTTINELIPGGPAMRSGLLAVGDRILAVGQGETGALTDIGGWRLDDAVALIRGSADSVVRLKVLSAGAPADGEHKVVALVRQKIALEDQSAKKALLAVDEEGTRASRRIGVITLPSFYRDFGSRQKGEQQFRSATRDVARLVQELKQEKVDALLLDLRNNGGGSLQEAIGVAALFVGAGPIVQERDAQGEIKVESGSVSERAWDGPLAVLINRGSASASEIFAAAIQDYQRGLIVGERSFGKGTVQALISLDELASKKKPELGNLKVTVGQFFRINGGTTQLRGVKPDIVFPLLVDPDESGEASFENALPWVKIKRAVYAPAGELKTRLPILERRHQARVEKNKDFQNRRENVAELKRLHDASVLSLNEAERRADRDALLSRLKSREARSGTGADQLVRPEDKGATSVAPAADGAPEALRDLSGEPAEPGARKPSRDIVLIEAVHILGDEAGLLDPGTKLEANAAAAIKRTRSKAFERVAESEVY